MTASPLANVNRAHVNELHRLTAGATLMLVIVAASYGISCFDRMLMVVVGETVKHEFALSDKQLSLLTGAAFVFIYGTFGVLAGWLVDRYNRCKILAIALAAWSLLTMACAMAGSFAQMALARAGVGIGEAPNAPTAFSLLSDFYPPAKRPMATAIFLIGGMTGMLLSFVGGSWIAATYGWRAAFLIAGPPGLIAAVLIYLFGREPPREGSAAAPQSNPNGLRLIVTDGPLLWVLAAQAFACFSSVGMMQWLPMFFIRTHHMSLVQVGALFGPAMTIGTIVGMVVGGFAGNRAAARSVPSMMWFCCAVMVIIVPLYIALLTVPSMTVALVLTFIVTAFAGVYIPVASAAWQTVCDPRARGVAGGISGLFAQLVGGAALPLAVGALSDHWAAGYGSESLRRALIASIAFCALGGVLFAVSARVTRERRSALLMAAGLQSVRY